MSNPWDIDLCLMYLLQLSNSLSFLLKRIIILSYILALASRSRLYLMSAYGRQTNTGRYHYFQMMKPVLTRMCFKQVLSMYVSFNYV